MGKRGAGWEGTATVLDSGLEMGEWTLRQRPGKPGARAWHVLGTGGTRVPAATEVRKLSRIPSLPCAAASQQRAEAQLQKCPEGFPALLTGEARRTKGK